MTADRTLDRAALLAEARSGAAWDIVVIGGGATGLGCAVDAASRGYRTLLLERGDFAVGTSSRSTKLVHGGVRYLRQGNVSLVLEALRERGRLLRNAPHLVRRTAFVVPAYGLADLPFYGTGLKLYDLLAGRAGFGRSRLLSRRRTLELLPTLAPAGLRGGVMYFDGQFDDARLAVNLAQTAAEQGAAPLNYVAVTGLTKANDKVTGVAARDEETGETFEVRAKVVVNATGVFADAVRRMDAPDAPPMLTPSQGAHVVLDRSFLPGETAVMVPKTDDGRVLFAIPWQGAVVVGTTDTPVREIAAEPRPLAEELAFLLDHAGRYLAKWPTPDDVLSAFAGLRPLAAGGNGAATAALSRDHAVVVSPAGLVTITGGKWTTYRKMAEEAIDRAARVGGLVLRSSATRDLGLHGRRDDAGDLGDLALYGADAVAVERLIAERPDYTERLHPRHPIRVGQVAWTVRHEAARTVEDVLARRTRLLLLDARAGIEAAPRAATVMAEELGRDAAWIASQVESFTRLARGYLMPDSRDAAAGGR